MGNLQQTRPLVIELPTGPISVHVSAPFAESAAEQPEIDLRPQRTPS